MSLCHSSFPNSPRILHLLSLYAVGALIERPPPRRSAVRCDLQQNRGANPGGCGHPPLRRGTETGATPEAPASGASRGRLRAPPVAEEASKKEGQRSKFCERMRAKNFGHRNRAAAPYNGVRLPSSDCRGRHPRRPELRAAGAPTLFIIHYSLFTIHHSRPAILPVARLAVKHYASSSRHTAWQAMPSLRPVKPRPSSVVAFTFTRSVGTSRSAARFWIICGM